ncbi:MAG: protein-L-isoaspartate(D-aspartate) O-methyltransferase [Phycisphaerae bacterium]|nr:protein-L-isoaspartate(D-aspartate) O-methyltransferase [Phycisphaerae bacterium]MDW8262020.1 protein-L-isoaspartate(D-aspartate) O-methyltransferase [Phycisphaerales bacterium]
MNDLHVESPLEQMIREQLLERGINDRRVIDAMRSVPRERFVPPSQRENAHLGRALAIGHGQTISEPYIVALMSAALDVQPGHRVLELGTGSGYQTAVLSRLAAEVFSIERVKPLLDAAFERLLDLGCRNVHFRFGDGTLGWPEAAPFDRVLVAAAAPQVPRGLLLAQLVDGGHAVIPVGPGQQQQLLRITRRGDQLEPVELCLCRFVPLIGKEGWPE